eukprot:Nk52_evm29s1763 gene=Nk52_evmTU29s1763
MKHCASLILLLVSCILASACLPSQVDANPSVTHPTHKTFSQYYEIMYHNHLTARGSTDNDTQIAEVRKMTCAYCVSEELKQFKHVHLFKDSLQNLAVVGYQPRLSAIVVVWRGTVTTPNLIEDLEMIPLPWKLNLRRLVHSGFQLSIFNDVQKKVKEVIRSLKSRREYHNAPIYVTGFSLGAAQAHISALDMVETLPRHMRSSVQPIVGGSPLVGNEKFAEYYKHKLPRAIHFTVKDDPVPQWPKLLGDVTVGNTVFLYTRTPASSSSTGNVEGCPNINSHLERFRVCRSLHYAQCEGSEAGFLKGHIKVHDLNNYVCHIKSHMK